jgi:ssDNA-binding Zn-finger/Zn-ribbon topoisomerase 1
MNAHCQECDAHFLVTPDTVVSGACPQCGGKRLERDQPSPTHSDGELRNMVNPDTGQDMGGNPLMEGIWGSIDKGWRPFPKRDESFAKVADSFGNCPDCGQPLTGFGLHGVRCPHCNYISETSEPATQPMFAPGDEFRYHDPEDPSLHGQVGIYQRADPNYAGAHFVKFPNRGANWVMGEHLMPTRGESDPAWAEFWHGSAVNIYEDNMNPYSRTSNMEPYDHWLYHDEPVQKTAGPLAAAVPLLGEGALGFLMRGALMGEGSNLVKGLFGQGDQAQAGNPGPSVPPPLPIQQFTHVAAGEDGSIPVETPTSNPGYHDTPDGDTHEFTDQASNPNIEQPNVSPDAGGASTDIGNPGDEPAGTGPDKPMFSADSPAVQRAQLLVPLLMHYYNSSESGAKDPMIRELHDMLEKEAPNYFKNIGPEHAHEFQTWMTQYNEPSAVHAKTADWSTVPDTRDVAPQQPAFAPGMGLTQQPGGGLPGVGQQGKCPYCGGVQMADGSCPQCGAKAPAGGSQMGTMPQQTSQPGRLPPGSPQSVPPGGYRAKTADAPHILGPQSLEEMELNSDRPSRVGLCEHCGYYGRIPLGTCPNCGERVTNPLGRMSAGDTQGPQTPEQVLAVQDYLKDQGRINEVPLVADEPWRFARELAEIAERASLAPNLQPGQQPTPPPMDPSMMGGGMPPGGPGMPPPMSHTAADNVAPRCPLCKSGTTGVLNDNNFRCHSCRYIWEAPDMVQEKLSATPVGDMRCPMCHGAGCANCGGTGKLWATRNADGPMLLQHDQAEDLLNPELYPRTDITMRYPNGRDPQAIQDVPYNIDPLDLRHRIGPQLNDPRWSHTAAGGEPDSSNVVGVPAADQTAAEDVREEQDTSLTFKDTNDQPLQPGQQYEMHSTNYAVPDLVRVDQVKPDEVVVSNIGQYEGDPNSPTDNGEVAQYQHPIDKRTLDMYGITFVPKADNDSDAGEQHLDEYSDRGQAPVFTEPIQSSFQRFAPLSEYDQYFGGEPGAAAKAKAAMVKQYGEKRGEEVFYATVNKKKHSTVEEPEPVDDGRCPNCTSSHTSSIMSSPTTEYHDCYRCGNSWETRVADISVEDGADQRAWLMQDGDDDFAANMERMLAMQQAEQGQQSRNLSQIASSDERYQTIKERLHENKMAREAGRAFSPREQRDFIEERGTARNSDLLDLEDTHYALKDSWDTSGDASRVRDADLFLGI